MDEIQKILIKAGRKDLAQEYYNKSAKKVLETYKKIAKNENKKLDK